MSVSLPRSLLERLAPGHDVFVETGTWDGACARMALDVGFKRVLTIDSDPQRLLGLVPSETPRLKCFCGPSEDMLAETIEGETGRILFWLDAHHVPGEVAPPEGMRCPLLFELSQIAGHPRNDHTILIDDLSAFDWLGVRYDLVIASLRGINPAYAISREDSLIGPAEILVAQKDPPARDSGRRA